MRHFHEELEDKPNRFRFLRLRRELRWRQEFEDCLRAASREIRLSLHLNQGQRARTAEIVVNVRDSMRTLLKKASRAFAIPSAMYKLVFSYVELPDDFCHQPERLEWHLQDDDDVEEFFRGQDQWMALEAYEECVLPLSSTFSVRPLSAGWNQLNYVRRLFLSERRHRRTARLGGARTMAGTMHECSVRDRATEGRTQDNGRRETGVQGMAVVVLEEGDGSPCRRQENTRVRPPMVTYHVDGGPGSSADERVGCFLVEGSVGTCLLTHRYLIDM